MIFQPFTVREGTFTSKIDYGAYVNTIVVTIEKKGSMKYFLNLNGLISTANCLIKESLEVRLILKKNYGFIAHMGDSGKEDVRTVLAPNDIMNNSHLLQMEYVSAVKIRFANQIGTSWSGDIPVSSATKKNSVLVRIPHKDKGKGCVTIWCKVVNEDLTGGITRNLFIFCVFMNLVVHSQDISRFCSIITKVAKIWSFFCMSSIDMPIEVLLRFKAFLALFTFKWPLCFMNK